MDYHSVVGACGGTIFFFFLGGGFVGETIERWCWWLGRYVASWLAAVVGHADY